MSPKWGAGDLRGLSQRELDDYLDDLMAKGREDSSEFERAYAEWERRESGDFDA